MFFRSVKITALTIFLSSVFINSVSAKEIIFAIGSEKGSLQYKTSAEFVRRVKMKLNEKFRINLYDSGTLGNDKSLMLKLQSNKIQLALPSSVMSSVIEEYAIFDLPFLIDDRAHMDRIEEKFLAKNLHESADSKGLIVLGFWENGFRHITNNTRPVIEPSDLNALKIRVPKSKWRKKMFNNWGASAVPLGFRDLYKSLKIGLVDGQENPYTNIFHSRLYEQQKYISVSGHVYSPAFLTVSKKWFELLDRDTQFILQSTAREMSKWSREVGESTELAVKRKLEDTGIIFSMVNRESFQQSSLPLYTDLQQAVPATRELIDAVNALREKIQ